MTPTAPPPYPMWTCRECGDAYGRGMPKDHVATWHTGICGVCGQEKTVTEPRDFRHFPNWPKPNPKPE
jgi:hypothetical protein